MKKDKYKYDRVEKKDNRKLNKDMNEVKTDNKQKKE